MRGISSFYQPNSVGWRAQDEVHNIAGGRGDISYRTLLINPFEQLKQDELQLQAKIVKSEKKISVELRSYLELQQDCADLQLKAELLSRAVESVLSLLRRANQAAGA